MISFDPTPSTLARIRVDDADALRFPPHSQLRSQSGQLQENANGKLLPSAEAHGCVTRHHAHHYLGFAATQWGLFEKEHPPRIKPLLYVYRVLLTGIHLIRTGRIEANLIALNDEFGLPYVPELVARKIHGAEKGTLESGETEFHRREYERLVAQLETEAASTHLPKEAACRDALNDLLVRVRLPSKQTDPAVGSP